jgi:hypothetical protein
MSSRRRQPGLVDAVALQMKHRALLEAGAHLVHADDADVGTGVHRPGRQVLVERQVRAPRLVDDQRLTAGVAHLGDAGQVRARAVWARTADKGAGRIGILVPGVADLLR